MNLILIVTSGSCISLSMILLFTCISPKQSLLLMNSNPNFVSTSHFCHAITFPHFITFDFITVITTIYHNCSVSRKIQNLFSRYMATDLPSMSNGHHKENILSCRNPDSVKNCIYLSNLASYHIKYTCTLQTPSYQLAIMYSTWHNISVDARRV
jgi:hypothetical protein